ncbi:hypothetical protein KR018_008642 [Drosophila ironensis]|nr:hypothetical protein KR018_008642 [Drosophila ironensis]
MDKRELFHHPPLPDSDSDLDSDSETELQPMLVPEQDRLAMLRPFTEFFLGMWDWIGMGILFLLFKLCAFGTIVVVGYYTAVEMAKGKIFFPVPSYYSLRADDYVYE